MADKPVAYFPGTALPSYQEIGKHLDTLGAFTQKAVVPLTANYLASGTINIDGAASAFSTWPVYGFFKNESSNEVGLYNSNNGSRLTVLAAARALDGSALAAGSIGQNIRFIESRILGQVINQILSELTSIDTAFNTPVPLTITANIAVADSHKIHTNVGATGATSGRIATLPAVTTRLRYPIIIENANGLRIKANTGDQIRSNELLSIAAGYIESLDPGASLEIIGIKANLWIARAKIGSWDVETS